MNAASPVIESKKVSRKVWAVVIAIVAVLAAAIAGLAYVVTAPGPPPRLVSVSYSPTDPTPSDIVTVEVVADGGSFADPLEIGLSYTSYFAGGESGGGGIGGYGVHRGSWQMGPFPNGTEVWLIASASTRAHGATISDEVTFQVGDVLRGGPSGLRFDQVSQTPTTVTTLDDVDITARVVSLSNVTRVQLLSFSFMRSGGGGGGGEPLLETDLDTYTGTIRPFGGPGGSGFERGTIFRYRLAAIDESGNTAVTATSTFTIR